MIESQGNDHQKQNFLLVYFLRKTSAAKLGKHAIKSRLFRILCRKDNNFSRHISSLFFAFMVVHHPVSSHHHAQAFQNMTDFNTKQITKCFCFKFFSFMKVYSYIIYIIYYIILYHIFISRVSLYACSIRRNNCCWKINTILCSSSRRV